MAIMWIAFTVYFQSLYMALAILAAIFTVFWYLRSLDAQKTFSTQTVPSWWWWKYVFVVIMSMYTTLAFVGFAVSATVGLMVMSFEAGTFLMAWLCIEAET
jgi:hypothetical protein